jgi:LysR family transcriptional regulator, low CO2-responsive transcriptional regulator
MNYLTLRQLRILSAVAKTGSMAGAGRQLHITPSAITIKMQELQEMAGLPLVKRIGERTIPTKAGEVLLRAAHRIEALLAECDHEIRQLKGIKGGRVAAGFVSSASYFALKALAAFRRHHPEVELRLAVGNRQETITALRGLALDLALIGRPPENLDLESVLLGDHPHIIVAPGGHPLAGKDVTIQGLANETFFIRERGSGTRLLMEGLFQEAGFTPNAGMETGSNETIKQAVSAGLGIAFISAHTVACEIADGRLTALKVEGLPVVHKWYVVRLREKSVMPAAEAMWRFLASEGHLFLPKAG